MLREVRDATFVLVVASPAYRQRAEGEAPAGVGRGVRWEAALIREEVYADREAALNRFLPVVLPGCAARDINDTGLLVGVALVGTPLGRRESTVPPELRTVWESLRSGPLVAAERMLAAGRQLAAAVFDGHSHTLVAEVLDRLPPGDGVDVIWEADGTALELPVELLRLTTATGEDLGPLALRSGVTVLRRVSGAPPVEPVTAPGPVKILAAVAALDESLTENPPLDAVTAVAGDPRAQVQILEVASVQQIVTALRADAADPAVVVLGGSLRSRGDGRRTDPPGGRPGHRHAGPGHRQLHHRAGRVVLPAAGRGFRRNAEREVG